MAMSGHDPMWYWWRQLQEEYQQPDEQSTPHSPSGGLRAETYSPHYVPNMPPKCSPPLVPGPSTPLAQIGPSVLGSLSFDIRLLRTSTGKEPSTPHKASAVGSSPPNPDKMQVDPQELSSTDALTITEASDTPVPQVCIIISAFLLLVLISFQRGPHHSAARGKKNSRRGAPPVQPVSTAVHFISFFILSFLLLLFRTSTSRGGP
jgi:hypothetical protein